jgi:hypothetical protein
LAGGEAHDHLNTGSSHMICIIFGQRRGFDFVDYPEQKNGCIGMQASQQIFSVLPRLAIRVQLIFMRLQL